MTFTSYAQNFEDVLLWRALGDIPDGRYIDIGAQDPIVDSVSLAFYEAGWRGVHVEPTPAYAQLLRDARPDETVIEAAIASKPGPLTFYEVPATGLSTGIAGIAKKHGAIGFKDRSIIVPTVRLDQLFEMFDRDFQWMKVDVEGMESDVLESWGESDRRPWVLVIESTFPLTQKPAQRSWIRSVLDRGYKKVHFDGLNLFFVHGSKDVLSKKFVGSPNVFDGFTVSPQHFSAKALVSAMNDEYARKEVEASARESQLTAKLDASLVHSATISNDLLSAVVQRETLSNELADVNGQLKDANDRLAQAESERREEVTQLMRDWRSSDAQHRADSERGLKDMSDQLVSALERLAIAEGERREEVNQLLRAWKIADDARECEMKRRTDETSFYISQYDLATITVQRLIQDYVRSQRGFWPRIVKGLGLSRGGSKLADLASWRPPASKSQPSEATAGNGAQESEPIMPSPELNMTRNPYLRANSLADLLARNDAKFVQCAYVTLLGRQPDPAGEAHFTDRIRCGEAKMAIVRDLRRSAEGGFHDPGISGLDRAIRQFDRSTRRWTGWMFRGSSDARNEACWRHELRRVSNSLYVLMEEREENTYQLNALHGVILSLQKAIEENHRQSSLIGSGFSQIEKTHSDAENIVSPPSVSCLNTDPTMDSRARFALNLLSREQKAS